MIGHLIEVKPLLLLSMPIATHPPDLSMGRLVSKSSGERCQVNVAASQSTEQRIERYRKEEEMSGGYGVVVTGELMALRKKGCRDEGTDCDLFIQLTGDNILK